MFNIGDEIIYSVHGLCKIVDICDKTIADTTRKYYVIHPAGNPTLTINAPVDNEKVVILKPLNAEEAKVIFQSFREPGVEWIDDVRQRSYQYNKKIKSGDRKEIAKVANTLMRKNHELSLNKRKLYDQDRKLLLNIQSTLFKELAFSLNKSYDEIHKEIEEMVAA